MRSYLDILRNVLENGVPKKPVRFNADGVPIPVTNGTIGTFAEIFRHDMADGFPLLTTKKMAWKPIRVELEGFIKGITDKKWYQDRDCGIWNSWSNPLGCPSWFSNKEKEEHSIKDSDLGPIYGKQWRNYNQRNVPTPRMMEDYQPTVCKIAAYGKTTDKFAKKLQATWYAMIRRCYWEADKDYPNYGAKGVYVVNRWLVFDKFVQDVQKIPGWENKVNKWNEYSLDKDYYGLKCYGPNSCIWLHTTEQGLLKSSIRPFYAIDPNNNVLIGHNIQKFAIKYNLDPCSISHCLSGKRASHQYWQFWREDDKNEVYTDQLGLIVKNLTTNPFDRRMVCSAWNPNQNNRMALPPCHFAWNVVVYGNKLNLIWHQRSCDLFLGVPFNIASYGLLLLLLAREARLEPGELVGTLNDCHLYENQLEQAREQLSRTPQALPKVWITGDKSIFEWTYEDVVLKDYVSAPTIKSDVTV